MKILGLILLVIATILLLLGIISPLNIIFLTIVAFLLAGFGALAIFKSRKNWMIGGGIISEKNN